MAPTAEETAEKGSVPEVAKGKSEGQGILYEKVCHQTAADPEADGLQGTHAGHDPTHVGEDTPRAFHRGSEDVEEQHRSIAAACGGLTWQALLPASSSIPLGAFGTCTPSGCALSFKFDGPMIWG